MILSSLGLAQNIDALKYFPYTTGNMWEYNWYDPEYPDTLQNFNIKDSVDSDGNIFVTQTARFINPIKPPALLSDTTIYKIDTSFNVFCLTCSFENQFLYKLNAKQGDQWVAYIYQDSSNIYGFELVRVNEVWEDNLFGTPTTFKNFRYYFATDSTDTLGLVRYESILAYNFGLYAKGGGDAVGQIFLKGCVVESVLYGDTTNVVTSIFDLSENPQQFKLYANYPNPFNPETIIKYEIPQISNVKIEVFDVLGRVIKVLADEQKTAGRYEIKFDASSLASGIYYYRIKANEFVQTKKMMLIK